MQFSFEWICTRSAHTLIMTTSFSRNWCSTWGFLALISKTQKLFTGTLSPFCGSNLGRVFVVGGSSSETTERDEWFLLQPLVLLPSLSIQPYGTRECVRGIALPSLAYWFWRRHSCMYVCAQKQCLQHKDNSCSRQQETAKDIFFTVSQWLLAFLFTSITSANLFYLFHSSFLTFILVRFLLSCDDSEVRKTFPFFSLIFMCAL